MVTHDSAATSPKREKNIHPTNPVNFSAFLVVPTPTSTHRKNPARMEGREAHDKPDYHELI
jgi:hypothetical protein